MLGVLSARPSCLVPPPVRVAQGSFVFPPPVVPPPLAHHVGGLVPLGGGVGRVRCDVIGVFPPASSSSLGSFRGFNPCVRPVGADVVRARLVFPHVNVHPVGQCRVSSSSIASAGCLGQQVYAPDVVPHCRLPCIDPSVCVCVAVLRPFVVVVLSLLSPSRRVMHLINHQVVPFCAAKLQYVALASSVVMLVQQVVPSA